jgi:hypothetical protein
MSNIAISDTAIDAAITAMGSESYEELSEHEAAIRVRGIIEAYLEADLREYLDDAIRKWRARREAVEAAAKKNKRRQQIAAMSEDELKDLARNGTPDDMRVAFEEKDSRAQSRKAHERSAKARREAEEATQRSIAAQAASIPSGGNDPPRGQLSPHAEAAARRISRAIWGQPYRPGEGPMHHAGGGYWRAEMFRLADNWESMARDARVCAEVLPS